MSLDHFTILKNHVVEIAMTCWYCSAFKSFWAVILGAFAFLIGLHNTELLVALTVLMAFDTITGLAGAKMQGVPIESRRFLKGATKLLAYFLLVSGAYLTEGIVPGTTFIFEAMISFLALTELISIMENVGKMGYTVPQKLLNQLSELKNSK